MLEFFTRITQDERLYAMAFCPAGQGEAVATPTLPATIRCDELDSFSGPSGHLLRSRDGPLLVSVRQLAIQGARTGRLVLVHDMSFIARRSEETRKYLFLFFIGLGGTVSLLRAIDRKSTRLNSSHTVISYAVFCLKKKKSKTRVADAITVFATVDQNHCCRRTRGRTIT